MTVPAETPEGRVEAAREGMAALICDLDKLLDKVEKQYEEVQCRDRRPDDV